MSELLLINPSRRKSARKRNPATRAKVKIALKSKHATKAEKAALRNWLKTDAAATRAIAGAKTTKPKRKATVAKAKRKVARKSAAKSPRKVTRKVARKVGARKSPRKIARRVKFTRAEARKYSSKSKRVKRSARTLGKRSAARRIYGINPLNLNSLKGLAVPALAGAVGGFVINMAFDKLEEQTWCPDIIKTNDYAKAGAKALIAIGASMALAKVKMISPNARNAALGGSLVIIAYDLLDTTVFPKVKEALGMDGYQMAGYQDVAGLGEFEYIDPTDDNDMAGLGYIGSSPITGFVGQGQRASTS